MEMYYFLTHVGEIDLACLHWGFVELTRPFNLLDYYYKELNLSYTESVRALPWTLIYQGKEMINKMVGLAFQRLRKEQVRPKYKDNETNNWIAIWKEYWGKRES